MDRQRAIRDGERAAVERWFPRSPLGQLFDPGDGRMLHIRDEAAARGRGEAFAVIDGFVAETRRLQRSGIVLIAAVALASVIAIAVHRGVYSAWAMGLGFAAAHILGALRYHRYKRDLAAVRARIRASLVASTGLPTELGDRFRRHNRWRTALNIWVGSMVIAAGLVAHATPDPFPSIAVTGGLAAIGIAWMLFFLARHADRDELVRS